jgi:hypothetical protein
LILPENGERTNNMTIYGKEWLTFIVAVIIVAQFLVTDYWLIYASQLLILWHLLFQLVAQRLMLIQEGQKMAIKL